MSIQKFFVVTGLMAAFAIQPAAANGTENVAATEPSQTSENAEGGTLLVPYDSTHAQYENILAKWRKAQQLKEIMEAAIHTGGLTAISGFTTEAETALNDNGGVDVAYDPETKSAVALTNGGAETLFALIYLQKDPHVKNGQAIHNPYPSIALLLGAYYIEAQAPEKALPALEAGLQQKLIHADGWAAEDGDLLSEKAVALLELHRLPEALKTYDEGLKVAEDKKDAPLEGRMLRGRGNILTEMGKLDDAEAAYKASLEVDPDNKIALNELKYIAGLKAGRPKQNSRVVLPSDKSGTQP